MKSVIRALVAGRVPPSLSDFQRPSGHVGCGPSALFQCDWTMKHGRSWLPSTVWAATGMVVMVVTIAAAPTMATVRPNAVLFMVLSLGKPAAGAGGCSQSWPAGAPVDGG